MPATETHRLAAFLKNRRERLDPVALGFAPQRRRTAGLRREEVAQRANISVTWYTWLEQGRGGAPSADVLERIARALMLTDAEREHLFVLGLGRLPDMKFKPVDAVSPRLQRVLDALDPSPALIKTPLWDVLAWNRAATVVLSDYAKLPPERRNILRLIFLEPRMRAAQSDWEHVARFVVAAFRADAIRFGAAEQLKTLVDDLSAGSADFARLWQENDVRAFGEGLKRIHHAELGELSMEFSSFLVEGRPDLGMLVYNPTTAEDAERIARLIEARDAARA